MIRIHITVQAVYVRAARGLRLIDKRYKRREISLLIFSSYIVPAQETMQLPPESTRSSAKTDRRDDTLWRRALGCWRRRG